MAIVASRSHPVRAHKRYIVSGRAVIDQDGQKVLGKLVSIGAGGLLVYCDFIPTIGANVGIEISVTGFDEGRPIFASGRVAWTQPGKVGLEFSKDPPGLIVLLLWLDRERCTWSSIA